MHIASSIPEYIFQRVVSTHNRSLRRHLSHHIQAMSIQPEYTTLSCSSESDNVSTTSSDDQTHKPHCRTCECFEEEVAEEHNKVRQLHIYNHQYTHIHRSISFKQRYTKESFRDSNVKMICSQQSLSNP